MTTATATRPTTQRRPANHRIALIGAGLLAGLVAALTMTALMAITRWLLGLPTPAEMIGDVYIPSLSLDQFFTLIGRFNGGNGIKRVGIGSVLIGQLVAGIIAGGVYGCLGERRGRIFAVAAGLVAWLVTIIPLRSVLHTNYRGLPAVPATALTVVGILLLYAAFGFVLVLTYRWMIATPAVKRGETAEVTAPIGRRALLVGGAGLVAAAVAGGLVRLLYNRSTLLYDGTRYRGPDIQPITPNDRFYSVTKNILDPDVVRSVWRLRLDGRVSRPRTFTFDELAALPGVTTQEATVSCVSNDVGDGLASNAVWKGISLRALLESAGLQQPTVKVVFHGADNYADTIFLDKAMDGTTFVAWEMNGESLPRRYGYPVRIIVPGRFGEKSVKWVTRIEVVDHDVKGFYERQGWGPTFTTQTFSRFDEPFGGQTLKPGETTRLHGVAFAGDRGIQHVEVSTDDGQTWTNARLDYQNSKIAWVLWSLDWQPARTGEYKLAVRAVDGKGDYQTPDTRGIAPDGATGYHRIIVRVQE
jgi:DMSO/TMAO reductase YedYZ molybdopterin-dependent catalytic subunit